MSELIIGVDNGIVGDEGADGRCTLHARKSGMNIVRRNERVMSFLRDQTRREGNEQSQRPVKSPMLNSRKWMALKSKGLKSGLIGRTDVVIGGNTAFVQK